MSEGPKQLGKPGISRRVFLSGVAAVTASEAAGIVSVGVTAAAGTVRQTTSTNSALLEPYSPYGEEGKIANGLYNFLNSHNEGLEASTKLSGFVFRTNYNRMRELFLDNLTIGEVKSIVDKFKGKNFYGFEISDVEDLIHKYSAEFGLSQDSLLLDLVKGILEKQISFLQNFSIDEVFENVDPESRKFFEDFIKSGEDFCRLEINKILSIKEKLDREKLEKKEKEDEEDEPNYESLLPKKPFLEGFDFSGLDNFKT